MAMGKELYASEGTMLKHLLSMYERGAFGLCKRVENKKNIWNKKG